MGMSRLLLKVVLGLGILKVSLVTCKWCQVPFVRLEDLSRLWR